MVFSTCSKQKNQVSVSVSKKGTEDELTCSVCLEQVTVGEVVRTLPCLHQFHADCIDPWLRQQGTCPVCKFKAHSGWQEQDDGTDDDDEASVMV
ncbi:hypothetical protein F2Q69_00061916 [Brassica cretica]|uniref:RING-type E3 ubiquitin transferase n=1 Tax=Brassica cretica TaxID=69181 RepID=A0A8S9RFH6_BRACR|nr:hypothetical protein F2Q69_00061916 [Brassica cretica]